MNPPSNSAPDTTGAAAADLKKTDSPSEATSAAIAGEFVKLVSEVMRSSAAPMIDFVERHELSVTQLKLVFLIAGCDEPVSIGQLAERSGASLPAAGRAVDGLVRQRLATRTEDPEDRRVKLVASTPLAERGIEQIYERRISTLRGLLDQLTPDQLNELAAAIAPLRELARNHDATDPENAGGSAR